MRVAKKDTHWFVADFETTGRNEYERTNRTRVWLWSIADENAEIAGDGDSIETFMEWCANHHGALIYFHNLRFDGAFILSYLLENYYPYEDKLLAHSKKGFTTLIGDMGEFYQMKINFASNRQVTIQDSLKLIPLTVEDIAHAFGLPIEKEVIDYDKYEINDVTLSYVHNDVRIVAMALKFFRDQGYIRMTIGSNAYHSFMDSNPNNKWLFPRLNKEFIEEWRNAYRGGRSQVNPIYEGKVLNNVYRFDINSMYPSIMANFPLPYGDPIPIESMGLFDFELYHVFIDFIIKDGHLPTLLKSSSIFNAKGETYWKDTEGVVELWISSIDYELLKEHYDINYIKFIKGFGFKTKIGIFKDWVNEMYENKSRYTGGLRLVYKLLLNSLYGKFGSRAVGQNKIPHLNDEGVLEYSLSEEHDMGLYYMPMAIAIVSWAHAIIDNAITTVGYDNFVYCDTDSVHTLTKLPEDMIDNKKLGKFKLEGIETISKYVRQKTYIYKQDGQWSLTCSGMTKGVKEYLIDRYGDDVINEFKVGLHIDEKTEGINNRKMKLRPIRVKGGIILIPAPFTIC